MKKWLLLILFGLISTVSFGQFSVSFHQSNLPFLAVNKQFGEKWIPEFRVGTDNFIKDVSLELVANHIFNKTNRFDLYGGFGGRTGFYEGFVVPAGINMYPFEQKDFGFHIEGAVLFPIRAGSNQIFRGSFGIRYRFLQN